MKNALASAIERIRRHNLIIEILLVAFAAAAFAGSVAYGAPLDGTRTVQVSYADLDVTTPQGAQALLSRLQTAAARVCSEFGVAAPALAWQVEQCYRTAVANALAQVGEQRARGLQPVANVRAG